MKKLLLALIVLLSIFSVSACNSNTSGNEQPPIEGEITLSFWHGFTGTDGNNMATMVEDFNKTYEGQIKVEVNRLDWDTLFTKFYQNKKNPRFSPNIIAVPANRLGSVVERDMVVEMNDVMEKLELTQNDFIDAAYIAGIFGDTRYSFPLDIHPTAIFYNKEITGEINAYSTWEEFYRACGEFTSGDVYGWAIPNNYSITKDIFYSQLLQNNTSIIDENNNPIFNSSIAASLLSKIMELKYGDSPVSSTTVSNGGDLTLFRAGKSAFYFDGPWMINTLKESCDFAEYGNLGVMPMPGSTGENGISFAGSHQLCLAKNTVTNESLRTACYTFFDYLSENALEWAKAGQVPARKSVHNLDEYKAISYLDAFTQTAYKANVGATTYSYFYEMYNYMGTGVSRGLNNEKSAQAALDEQVNNYKRWLAEQ